MRDCKSLSNTPRDASESSSINRIELVSEATIPYRIESVILGKYSVPCKRLNVHRFPPSIVPSASPSLIINHPLLGINSRLS